MTTLINQELAKIEKRESAYGKSVDPAMDAFSEAWKMGQEQRAWKERKNAQRQQLMGQLAQGTGMTFNEKDLERKKERFQNYYNKHRSSMDESTLEMGQMMLDDFGYQQEKNKDFEGMQLQFDDMQTYMQETVSQLGTEIDAEGNKVSRTLNNDDLKLIDEMNTEYLGFRSKFLTNHADRLSLKPYQHISTMLDAGKQMNTFLVNEAYEDNLIDDKELEAWNMSWEGETLDPIQTYKNKQGYLDKAIVEKNTKDIMSAYDEYNQLNNWVKGIGAIEVALPGETKGTLRTYGELQKESPSLAAAYKQKLNSLHNPITGTGKIMNLDSGIERQLGISWLKDQNIEMPVATKEETEEFKHKEKIKELIPELGGAVKPSGWKKGEELVEREEGILPSEAPLTEEEIKTSEKLKKDLEIQEQANRGLIAKGTDIAADIATYIPAVYLGKKAAQPLIDKAKHFVGSQITKSIDNVKALTGLNPQQAVDWMGDKTVQKQVGKAQGLQDALAEALKKGGKKSAAVIEATKNLDNYVNDTVKKLMKKKKFQGMSVEQMTKLLKDTKKWSTLKMLAGTYKHYPSLKQWVGKGGYRAFLPGGAYAGFRTLMVAGEKLGDPTGGLGTAITGTALYSNLKSRLTKKLATKAGRQLIAKKLGSIGAKRLAQSIGAGTASTLWTGPGAAAGAVIGGIVGTTWALYDAWDLFFGEEEEEE